MMSSLYKAGADTSVSGGKMVESVKYDEERDTVMLEFGLEDETAGDVYVMQKLLKLATESILNIYDAVIDIAITRAIHDYDVTYIHDKTMYIYSKMNEVNEIIQRWAKKLGITLG
jgi:DUF2075 family protein